MLQDAMAGASPSLFSALLCAPHLLLVFEDALWRRDVWGQHLDFSFFLGNNKGMLI